MTWPGDPEPAAPRPGPRPGPRLGPRLGPLLVIGGLVLVIAVNVLLVLSLRPHGRVATADQLPESPVPASSPVDSVTSALLGPASSPIAPLQPTAATVTTSRPAAVKSSAPSAAASVPAKPAGASASVPAALEHPPSAQPTAPVSAPPEEVGLVDVDATLGVQDELAEGTGMLLTSTGEVLTNNHVIEGATTIAVTVIATGATYRATVVGVDIGADVAVLQLVAAPALPVAPFGDSNTVAVGNAVVGVGNAGGIGGAPTAAPGIVIALDQSITATSEDGGVAEQLTGLIASNAQIQPGDSGGPLYNAADQIIGMDTAGGAIASGEIIAFSIPINNALAIVHQIEDGSTAPAIQLGSPAFLGITATNAAGSAGAVVGQVLSATPAAAAGIEPGDVITGLGGAPIASAAALGAALAAHHPGDQVTLTWTRPGPSGPTSASATMTLAAGPAA